MPTEKEVVLSSPTGCLFVSRIKQTNKTFEWFCMTFDSMMEAISRINCKFVYRESQSVEDTTHFHINTIVSHQDKKRTYARTRFIDFGSAFNAIQPHIMLRKLKEKKVNSKPIKWIQNLSLVENSMFVLKIHFLGAQR